MLGCVKTAAVSIVIRNAEPESTRGPSLIHGSLRSSGGNTLQTFVVVSWVWPYCLGDAPSL